MCFSPPLWGGRGGGPVRSGCPPLIKVHFSLFAIAVWSQKCVSFCELSILFRLVGLLPFLGAPSLYLFIYLSVYLLFLFLRCLFIVWFCCSLFRVISALAPHRFFDVRCCVLGLPRWRFVGGSHSWVSLLVLLVLFLAVCSFLMFPSVGGFARL